MGPMPTKMVNDGAISTVVFGPGSIDQAHAMDEFVDLAEGRPGGPHAGGPGARDRVSPPAANADQAGRGNEGVDPHGSAGPHRFLRCEQDPVHVIGALEARVGHGGRPSPTCATMASNMVLNMSGA